MWSKLVETEGVELELPVREAQVLSAMADPSFYVWHLVTAREQEVRSAAAAISRAGWTADEAMAGAVAWAAYFGGPPTEAIPERELPTRALVWGGEASGVLSRLELDPASWSLRAASLGEDPDLASTIGTLARYLMDGAGEPLLRQRVDDAYRR